MSKYLFFIILGIVIFIYINSIEGLNIGIPTSVDVCASPLERQNILKIKLLTNKNEEFCFTNRDRQIDRCKIVDESYFSRESCYHDCDKLSSDDDKEICKEKNSTFSCWQICDFNEIRDFGEAIDVEHNRLGFSKINRLVDLDSQPFIGYIDALNESDLNNVFTSKNTINGLSFSEYKLKQYLERINNKSIKYIKPNIYYCNGKIYYYICTTSNVRVAHNLTSEEYNTRIRQDHLSEKYYFVNNDHNIPSAPYIHLDYSNINNDSDYLDLLNEKDIELSVGCQQTQDYNTYQDFLWV